MTEPQPLSEHTADVIVVGAGPAGSTTAYYLAKAGLDVLLLEKTAFPREKVCGDGLTPRATKQLVVDGHRHLRGGRLAAEQGPADHRRRRPPPAGLAGSRLLPGLRPRPQARRLRRATGPPGAEGGRAAVRALQRRRADHRRPHRPHHRRAREARRATKTRGHLPRPAGRGRRRQLHPPVPGDGPAPPRGPPDGRGRPYVLHVARATTTTTWSPGWSCGTAEAPARTGCCPATAGSSAWATARPTSASGVLNTSDSFKELDWREVLKAWCASMPEDWGYTPENMTGPIRGAALPMAFNRQPHYTKGLLLVGDAGGLVNPFNGEGIAYAMESGPDRRRRHRPGPRPRDPGPARDRPPALPARPQGHLRRLLHAGPRLREAHRQPEGHEDRDPARPDPPAADEVHPEDARQPHRPDGRRRDGPHHQRAVARWRRRRKRPAAMATGVVVCCVL